MQRNPRYREDSSRLPRSRFLHPYFVHSKRRCGARFGYTYNVARVLSLVSPSRALVPRFLSFFSPRVISYPRRYYERTCNGNRRMIHGDVKRDGSRYRLETQSLPIHERPMEGKPRLLLLKISKRQSVKRVDIGKAPGGPRRHLIPFPVTNGD